MADFRKNANETPSDAPRRQSAFSRAIHSIRTRYAFATAMFLLVILGIFYIGGRITLVHLLRDAEKQVKEIGDDIGRLAYRNAAHVREFVTQKAAGISASLDKGLDSPLESFLGNKGEHEISLAMYLTDDGTLIEGVVPGPGGKAVRITGKDFKPYAKAFHDWAATLASGVPPPSTGLVRIRGNTHYVSLAHIASGGYLALGAPFNTGIFSSKMDGNFAGATVRVTNRRADIAVSISAPSSSAAQKRMSFGIVPMLSEAVDFYSGGFWKLGTNPFEAVFTIRDIAGNAVSMIAVSLPRTFSKITTLALGRLTFFIAMIGILLILPIFWLQNHMLLNPLSKMIERIREISERHDDTNCPQLEWSGKDEFALLATSVNRMLETLSRRTIAIAESESRQRALLAAAPDGFAVFDRSHRLVTVIKHPDGVEPFPGLVEREPPSPEVWGESGTHAFNTAVDASFEGDREKSRAHLATKTASGATRDVEFRFSRMDDHFTLALMRDITSDYAEHRRLISTEQRRGHASKQESMALLAAGIAHDVNNILSIVLNTAEITWMDETDNEVRAAVDTIRDAVRRGSGMMRELMAFAGETKISLKQMDPADIVREAQRLAARATTPNVSVTYDLPSGLPPVDVDPDQMWKVFFNLIKNASEAMKTRPGAIEVSARACNLTQSAAEAFMCSSPLKPGPGVLFRISDNGPGINPLLVKRIFDPYISSKGSGHGLGLAIVYATVDAHGGGIRVISALERGTTFEIFLPAASTLAPQEAPKAADSALGDILLVDDDDSILRTTSILLRTMKATVHTAKDRHAALLQFRALAPRLKAVILDAHIGPLSTVRLLRIFRLVAPNIPVVITSGSSPEAIEELFSEQPYNAFLAKPYTLAELKSAIASAMRG